MTTNIPNPEPIHELDGKPKKRGLIWLVAFLIVAGVAGYAVYKAGQPGQIISNEPGYYREGAFGIRIENLIVVEEAPPLPGGDAHRRMLQFRTLTFVPIDRRLIDAGALSPDERGWLNAYHAEVLDRIGPRLSDAARDWLVRATAPV